MFKFSRLKHLLFEALESPTSRIGHQVALFLGTLIIFSVFVFSLESFPELEYYRPLLHTVDSAILVVFFIEYLFRFYVARNKRKFVFSLLGIVDLIVILPLFTNVIPELYFLRSLRLLEVLRIFKVLRYSNLVRSFLHSFRYYKEELKILWLSFMVVFVLAAFGMYSLEGHINPNINNMLDSFWWAIITMATVGYGDIVPITIPGKILSVIVIIFGLATIAIMTAILTKIFSDHFFGKRTHRCNTCHFPRHDHDAHYCKNCGNELDKTVIPPAHRRQPIS